MEENNVEQNSLIDIYYVCCPDDDYEVYHPMYITANEDKARKYFAVCTDESIQALVAHKKVDLSKEPIFKGDPHEDYDVYDDTPWEKRPGFAKYTYTFHNMYKELILGDISEEDYAKYTEVWTDGRPVPEKIYEITAK